MTTDINGREYARLSAVKEGDFLEPDTGFDCLEGGVKYRVRFDGEKLRIDCSSEGGHALEGQEDEEGYLIGLYLEPDS